jgi:hypothetical protein
MVDLPLPFPFKKRPRIGSRRLVRNYVRRYLKALYKELADWIDENKGRSASLLLCCVVYAEDYMTQYLDHFLISLYKAILDKTNKVVMEKVPLILQLIGRFCDPTAYHKVLCMAMKNELAAQFSWT